MVVAKAKAKLEDGLRNDNAVLDFAEENLREFLKVLGN